MNAHDDMDDTAEFAASRFMPAESCTEIGADPENKGCGTRGTGPGPWELLLISVCLTCAAMAMTLPYWERLL